jgi:hypothetical protein
MHLTEEVSSATARRRARKPVDLRHMLPNASAAEQPIGRYCRTNDQIETEKSLDICRIDQERSKL